MTVAFAARPPSDAVAALVAEVGANPCAFFDAADAVVWTNSAAEKLLAALGPDAFGKFADRRGVMATGKMARKRFEIGPAGQRREFTARFSPVASQPGQVFCAVADVTGEIRAMKALRDVTQRSNELVSLVSDCIWELDADWRLTHFALREADAPSARALIGQNLFDVGVFDPPTRGGARPPTPRHRALFRAAAFRLRIGDAERVLLFSGMPLFDDASGAFLGYRGAGDDVTDRFRAEGAAGEARAALLQTLDTLSARNAELDTALVGARAADTAKDEFLARMSHELRTPLNAVLGLSGILKLSVADRVDDSHMRFLDEIHRAGRHLLALVNDVLEFSRGRLATVKLKVEPGDLGEITGESIAFLRFAAEERGVSLALEQGPGLTLSADKTRLRQVFINFVGNAVKFSPNGGAVTVSLRRDARRLVAEVRDEGPGVPKEMIERVFDPFFQIGGGSSRSHGGIGLGLALCRQFVTLHGGEVSLESVEGCGTTVRFWLPDGATGTG